MAAPFSRLAGNASVKVRGNLRVVSFCMVIFLVVAFMLSGLSLVCEIPTANGAAPDFSLTNSNPVIQDTRWPGLPGADVLNGHSFA